MSWFMPITPGAGKTKRDKQGPRRGLSEARRQSPSKQPSMWTWVPSAGHWRIYDDAYLGTPPGSKRLSLWSSTFWVEFPGTISHNRAHQFAPKKIDFHIILCLGLCTSPSFVSLFPLCSLRHSYHVDSGMHFCFLSSLWYKIWIK